MIQLKETGTELCAAWNQGGTKSEFDSGGALFEAAIGSKGLEDETGLQLWGTFSNSKKFTYIVINTTGRI